MDAVIQMNRRQRNHEIDWDERRFEITKAALYIVPLFQDINCNGTVSPEKNGKESCRDCRCSHCGINDN